MITESLINNPQHPCGFCSKLVPLGQPYCDNACRTGDELLKVLDSNFMTEEKFDETFNRWCESNKNFAP